MYSKNFSVYVLTFYFFILLWWFLSSFFWSSFFGSPKTTIQSILVQSVCSKKSKAAHKCGAWHGMLKSERHILWWYTCKNMKYSYFLWELFSPSSIFCYTSSNSLPAFCQWLVFSVYVVVVVIHISFSPHIQFFYVSPNQMCQSNLWRHVRLLLPWHKNNKRSV